ncbi:Blue-light-activated histidine kinase [Ensifer psoraleae]|uniref:sensor histidine kinase n=1 Tax=Sinorhizobium psoraleae TaxID=520838 RepID=UPI001567D150|nr:PAS domain-containing protein [Sinorhizobium psoraleae]NRP74258.1 Blue-light-activated histidine kinase [Sinorhizobium psoraleae]
MIDGSDSAGSAGDARQRFGLAGLAEAIVETLDQPLLILTSNLTIADVNSAYCETFGVTAEETRGQPIYRLGNGQWDIPELRRLLEQVLPERTTVKGYRIEHKFPDIGRRVMILNARRITDDDGRPELILLTVSDRTQAEQTQFELEGHREFLEKLIDSVREGLLVLGWDLKVIRANQTFYDLFQVSPAHTEGRLVYELGNRQWDIPKLRELLEDVLPDNNAFDDVEVEHDFETIGRRIMLLNGRRLDHLDLILLAIRDVTEQRRMEAQQQTLMGELHHRVKNVLSSVNALANRSLHESQSLDEFRDRFATRLGSLSRTQDLLMRAPEHDVRMAEVLRLELEAQGGHEGKNYQLDGPVVTLSRETTQAFAMAIHELATNAVKHGAWATPEGRLKVTWTAHRRKGNGTLISFRWRENGRDIDTAPARKGYGSQVLERVFSHSLDGTSELTLHPDGAEFAAEFKLQD